MKTYTGKHEGLLFEFDMPDDATVSEIKVEVNRILREPGLLLEACKKACSKREERVTEEISFLKKKISFLESQVSFYEEHYLKALESAVLQSELMTRLITATKEE